MQVLKPDKPMLDGDPPLPGMEDNRQPLQLKAVVCNALMVFDPQAKMSGEEKVKRYELAMRVMGSDLVAKGDGFKPEEIAKMKSCIGDVYGPVIVGPSFKMLDAAEGDKQDEETEDKVAGEIPAKE
jgi:hypothetical protein